MTVIRTSIGRSAAVAVAPYTEGQGEVPTLRAWILPQGRIDEARGVSGALDLAASADEIHGEGRFLLVTAEELVRPGDVFVSESICEERLLFLQWDRLVRTDRASRRVRLSVAVPAAWTLTALAVRHRPEPSAAIEHASEWNHEQVPERDSVDVDSDRIPDRLAFSVRPATSVRARAFESWQEVGAWLDGLATATRPDPEVLGLADRLRGEHGSATASLRALMTRVQAIRYVSIQTGVGRGGGYRPRPAGQVLQRGFGDCKDKANLLCSVARAMGHRAWLVPVHSRSREWVFEQWPTPQQFDHCIAAIEVPADLQGAAVADIEQFGRLLFLDPTDPHTLFGELPQALHGGLGLIVDPQQAMLHRLPDAGSEGMRSAWNVAGRLDESGSMTALVEYRAGGGAAAHARAAARALGEGGALERFKRSLLRTRAGARIDSVTLQAQETNGDWTARFRWARPRQAELTADGKLMLRLLPWASSAVWDPDEPEREREAEARSERERYDLALPAGAVVEGVPMDTTLLAAGRRFEERAWVSKDTLVVERTRILDRTVPGTLAKLEQQGHEESVRRLMRRTWVITPAKPATRP